MNYLNLILFLLIVIACGVLVYVFTKEPGATTEKTWYQKIF